MESTEARPTRIFHLITKANWGGAQVYVQSLIQGSYAMNAECTLIYGIKGALLESLPNIPHIHIPTLERNVRILGDVKTLWSLYTLFKKERPDVVHLHSSKASVIGSIAARLAHCPRIVFTAHGWPYNELRPWWQKSIFYFLSWCAVAASHVTICVSHAVHAQSPYFLHKKKLRTIHNGVSSVPLFSKENSLKELGIHIEKKMHIFGSIGELHPNKGFDILIRSFALLHKKHQNTHLSIIGEGESRALLEKYIYVEKLENAITLHGYIKNAREYIHAFNTFILPSRTEALGYVLLEAGLAKIPCIATQVGGIPEIIHQKETGLLVSHTDVRELCAAMEYALLHTTIMHTYADSLFRKVSSEYTENEMLKKTYALYSTPKNS